MSPYPMQLANIKFALLEVVQENPLSKGKETQKATMHDNMLPKIIDPTTQIIV